MIRNISVLQAFQMLQNNQAILIDVRELDEYNEIHISNSIHIPLAKITLNIIPETDKAIIMQCRSGKRSYIACEKIYSLNNDLEIYNLEGGIIEWQINSLPVVFAQE